MMLKMTAVLVGVYARQFDPFPFGSHPLDQYRPVAAPVPPDMLEALRLTQQQVEEYHETRAHMLAFAAVNGSPTGRIIKSEPVLYGDGGATFTLNKRESDRVFGDLPGLDYESIEKRIMAHVASEGLKNGS
ncbi:hypothetical protein [Burkholderia phage BCSR129]|nr:hypothetical protein [Burkholderia phage BCSR129]